jgi:hypothetical protein
MDFSSVRRVNGAQRARQVQGRASPTIPTQLDADHAVTAAQAAPGTAAVQAHVQPPDTADTPPGSHLDQTA